MSGPIVVAGSFGFQPGRNVRTRRGQPGEEAAVVVHAFGVSTRRLAAEHF